MANQINIGIGANITDLQQGLKMAVSTMEKSGQDMSKVAESVSRLTSSNFKTISQAYRQTSKDAETLALHLGTESDAFRQAAQMANAYGQQLNDVRAKIAGVDMSQTATATKNAAGGFNMLGHSINQLTRELPSFTYSVQTGFMALSNNIPMFVDQINSISQANKALAATGQPVQSVFSQVSAAFFSWNTVLSLGITALTVFSPMLIEMVTGMDEVAKTTEKAAISLDQFNESFQQYINNDITNQINAEKKKYSEFKTSLQTYVDYYESMQKVMAAGDRQMDAESTKRYYESKKQLQQLEQAHQTKLNEIVDKEAKARAERERDYSFSVYEDKGGAMAERLAQFKAFFEQPFDVSNVESDLSGLSEGFNNYGMNVTAAAAAHEQAMQQITDSRPFAEMLLTVQEWQSMMVNAIMGASQAMGQALVSGDFEKAGQQVVKMLGGIAIQIGAAMVAMGVPMTFAVATAPEGLKLIAGGIALGVAGGAMQASGNASGSSSMGGGGGYQPQSSYSPFSPTFGGGSQYLMLDSRVRGTDIIISADNQRRQNRRIR